ncbi:apolipoprotein N-acyltransferase [Actinomyces sp. MRS3W]|uniref:apolipoprotein N-acyltransferase n=1 Tax=Actinomyces sp. MRS3W TaxID=2800796 RepID=UPI0028FD5191|nr:apolipoprotein N-acyltransferase [Actinomyces sp. MRS3W]MDU0348974.1 apolipoprotein N-acyltransferase [Actinomyces sp. MRS3W]
MSMRKRWGASVLIAGCAGLGVWAAFPPLGWWWAAPLGLALLASVLRDRGPWTGAGLGLVFGIALFTPLLHFTAVAMGNPIGWAALTVVESLYLAVFGAAWALASRIGVLQRHGTLTVLARIVAFTVLWCGVEEVRSSWPWGGFPFGRLAFAMADAPMLPFAAYGGAVGLSALVACAGAGLAEAGRALREHRALNALAAAALAGVVAVAPMLLPVDGAAEDGTLRVGAVQGNVAEEFEDAFNRALEVTGNHAEATRQLADDVGTGALDVVIWPENAADLDPRATPASAALVESSAQAVGAPILVGAILYANGERYNDVVVWTPGQGAGEYYRKHRPVPFAEYVPLRDQLRHLTRQVDRIGTDLAPGTGPYTLPVHAAVQDRDVLLAMGICFEVAYDDTLRSGVEQGGELIVIPTNNASFLTSSEAEQQLAQGRVQAVIHGRALVQVSTVGVTAIINPRGGVEQRTEAYTQAALVADVPLRTSITVADRLGALPGRALEMGAALLAVAGMVSGMARLRRRRRRNVARSRRRRRT